MDFQEPFKIYTAANNIEAHLIVEMLTSHGVAAFVEEDHSGASLWAFGMNSQVYQPNVWIEKSTADEAAQIIRQFEQRQQDLGEPGQYDAPITVRCEQCGKTSEFPNSLYGTSQQCSHCDAYLDVGAWNGSDEDDGSEDADEP